MLKKLTSRTAKDWIVSYKKKLTENRAVNRLTMCRTCFTFYYKNSWHFDKPSYFEVDEKEIPVRFMMCPTCLDLEVASYEMESA